MQHLRWRILHGPTLVSFPWLVSQWSFSSHKFVFKTRIKTLQNTRLYRSKIHLDRNFKLLLTYSGPEPNEYNGYLKNIWKSEMGEINANTFRLQNTSKI